MLLSSADVMMHKVRGYLSAYSQAQETTMVQTIGETICKTV